MICIETEMEKINKEVNQAVKGFKGYERAIKICEFFEEQGEHPHPDFTFNTMAMNRENDTKFATELRDEMSHLVATNRILKLEQDLEDKNKKKSKRRFRM
ncbi:hypothetical protein K7J31_002896 [Vibrio parahaemolyticus]|nr:hypothetical protein [Vibrio parahaemolyticus]